LLTQESSYRLCIGDFFREVYGSKGAVSEKAQLAKKVIFDEWEGYVSVFGSRRETNTDTSRAEPKIIFFALARSETAPLEPKHSQQERFFSKTWKLLCQKSLTFPFFCV